MISITCIRFEVRTSGEVKRQLLLADGNGLRSDLESDFENDPHRFPVPEGLAFLQQLHESGR